MLGNACVVLALAAVSPPIVGVHVNPWNSTSTVTLIDAETLAPIGSAQFKGLAEPLHFDAASGALFVLVRPRKASKETSLWGVDAHSAEAALVTSLGRQLRESFLDSSRTRLYVVAGIKTSKPKTVSVFDLSAERSHRFLAGVERLSSAQLSPDETLLFALCEGKPHKKPRGPPGSVHILDARTGMERARLEAGRAPTSIAFDTTRGLAYVLGATDEQGNGKLTIVRDDTVAGRLATPGIPTGLRVAPDGTAFVLTSRAVVALDRDGQAAARSWEIGFEPSDLIFDMEHDLMFAGARSASTIAKMRISGAEVLAKHATGSAGRKFGKGVGTAVYVAFAILAAAGGASFGPIPGGSTSTSMILGEGGTFLYVLNPYTNDVSIYDVAKDDVVDILHVGGGCTRFVRLQGERDFWVEARNRLVRINATTNRIDRTIDLPGLGFKSVTYDPDRTRAWASLGGRVLVIDLRTGQVTGQADLPKPVSAVWYESATSIP